jgi:hypothetical protein
MSTHFVAPATIRAPMLTPADISPANRVALARIHRAKPWRRGGGYGYGDNSVGFKHAQRLVHLGLARVDYVVGSGSRLVLTGLGMNMQAVIEARRERRAGTPGRGK